MIRNFVCFVVLCGLGAAQQTHYFNPVPHSQQILRGSAAANSGAIGLDVKDENGTVVVKTVAPNSPAERAGIKIGDAVRTVQGTATTSHSQFTETLPKTVGASVNITIDRDGHEMPITVVTESRPKVYPEVFAKELSAPPGISDFFQQHWGITTMLSQNADTPNQVALYVQVAGQQGDTPPLNVDMGKFFVLDGQGQRLTQVTGDQAKYGIQLWLAQNWRGGTYAAPPPPAPQHNYMITGTSNGNYIVQDVGPGISTISGTTNSSYSVTQQPDYSQMGYALGLAIRQWKDRRHDKKLLEEAQKTIAFIDQVTFKPPEGTLLPGEVRQGEILYWSGSTRAISPPFEVPSISLPTFCSLCCRCNQRPHELDLVLVA